MKKVPAVRFKAPQVKTVSIAAREPNEQKKSEVNFRQTRSMSRKAD